MAILKLENTNFNNTKNPISIIYVSINKTIVSSKFPFAKKGFEYFIGHKDVRKVRPVCLFLPKTTA